MPKGTLVIRAAELLGIQIPRFCDHPLLDPVGACRQCLVEVGGPAQAAGLLHHRRAPRAWWCTPSSPPPVAEKAQRGVMELLLINHPLDCPMCDKGGECPLQNQAMSNGQGETRFTGDEADLRQADRRSPPRCCSTASAASSAPGAPGSPSRSPATRSSTSSSAGRQGAGRHRRGRAVQLLLLRQHRADLPGRRADRRRLPVPGPAVRPGLHAERVRALRVRLRAAHRPPARQGHPPAGRRRPGRSTRSGTATRAAGPSPTRPSPTGSSTPLVRDEDGRAGPGLLAGGAGGRRGQGLAAARGRAGVLAGGRLTRRGRLRLRQVRPDRAGHQRHRLPGPAALGRGGAVPGRARRRARASRSATPTWSRPRPCCWSGFEPEEESPIVFLRLRKAVRKQRPEGLLDRPVRQPRPGQDGRHAASAPLPGRARPTALGRA